LGAVGIQVASVVVVGVAPLWLAGQRSPARRLRAAVSGFELWIAASLAVGGTCVRLFFTGFANFFPGEAGW
jgi:hypothetical protein